MYAKTLFDANALGAQNSVEAARMGGLDWICQQSPLTYNGLNGSVIIDRLANFRSDNGELLGIVSARYHVCQNSEAFAMLDDVAGAGGQLQYETAGTLYGGRKCFMTARLPNRKIVDDEIANYIFVGNSFDGSLPFCMGLTNIRIVCKNTLQMAIKNAPRIWKVRHSINFEGRQEEAARALELTDAYLDGLAVKAEALAAKKVDAEKLVLRLFPDADTKMAQGTVDKRREAVFDLIRNKPDLQNLRGTAWGLYQAVADYVSNGEPLKQAQTYLDHKRYNLLFGDATLERAQKLVEAA